MHGHWHFVMSGKSANAEKHIMTKHGGDNEVVKYIRKTEVEIHRCTVIRWLCWHHKCKIKVIVIVGKGCELDCCLSVAA